MTQEDAIFEACVGNHNTNTEWIVLKEDEEFIACPKVSRNEYEDAEEIQTVQAWQEEFGVNEEGSPEEHEHALRELIRYYLAQD